MKTLREKIYSKFNMTAIFIFILCLIILCLYFIGLSDNKSVESIPSSTYFNGEIDQWYYQNNGSFNNFINDDMAWEGDKKIAKQNIDIDYNDFSVDSSKRKITVAIIDTDIDYNHKAIKNSIWENKHEKLDNIDNDNNGYVDDIRGWNFVNDNNQLFNAKDYAEHGTYVSGILVGSDNTNKFKGMLGSYAEVMCLKTLDNKQIGKIERIIKAIHYAEANGAKICVMAFATYDRNEQLDKVIQNSKMLFIVPSGNDSVELDNELMTYPAGYNCDNMISVADIRCDGNISATSNYGMRIDITAPGTDIITTSPFNKYEIVNGTSLAVPFVAGTAALLYTHSPRLLKANELKDSIINHAKIISTLENKVLCSGIVNVNATISNNK